MTIFHRLKRHRGLLFAIASVIAIGAIGVFIGNRTVMPSPQSGAVASDARGSESIRDNKQSTLARAVSHSRTVAAAPLPPSGTPLNQIFDDLKSRADAGDVAAASRLFNDLSQCRRAQAMKTTTASLARMSLDKDVSKMTAQQIESNEKLLAYLQHQLDDAKDSEALCNGLERAQLQQLMPITLRAAQLGDDGAANCYVEGVALLRDGVLDHPEWLAEYKRNAWTIADQALQRGDWSMVSVVESSYGNAYTMYNVAPFSQITGYDPVKQYQYLSLLQLGGAPAVNDLDALIPGLTADDIAAGDAWARDVYQRYFSAQPNVSAAPKNTCRGSEY